MFKRLFTLLMIFALGGSVFAGVPLSSNSNDCPMSKMMKCCQRKSAGQHTPPKELTKANLCRLLMSEQSGTTASNVQLPQLSTLISLVVYLHTFDFSPSKQAENFRVNSSHTISSVYNIPIFIQNQSFRI